MTNEQYAYSTDNPETVAAYRKTREELAAYGERMMADCAALGGNNGPLARGGIWGRPDEVVGLDPDGSGTIPDGWRIVRGRLEPKRGKPGEAARQWLADRQPPDVRHVLTKHGLPRHASLPAHGRGMTHRLVAPVLFELDGTLWACYAGRPGDGFLDADGACTWTPRRLSEFYAAREEAQRRQAAESGAQVVGR